MINLYELERKMNQLTSEDRFYQEYLDKYKPTKEDKLTAFKRARERSRARRNSNLAIEKITS